MSDDRIRLLLARIEEAAAGREPFEESNLGRDLEAVLARLASGEYREADFAVRSVFELSRRTREYYAYFAGWNRQAERWASILAPFAPSSAIIDLCPGWAPKIELALMKLGFTGRALLVEKSHAAQSALLEFMAMLSPRFTIELAGSDLFAPSIAAPVVVGNHLLDDVLLDRWATSKGADVDRIYEDEVLLRDAWRDLLDDMPAIEAEVAESLAAVLPRYLSPGGRLILSHYDSLAERLLGSSELRAGFASLFSAVKRALIDRGLVEIGADAGLAVFNLRA